MSNKCTHTSDWWKNMVPCCVCGEMYDDEEAERIAERGTTCVAETTQQQEVD